MKINKINNINKNSIQDVEKEYNEIMDVSKSHPFYHKIMKFLEQYKIIDKYMQLVESYNRKKYICTTSDKCE